jgi:uncharacterized protein (DUF433 family)
MPFVPRESALASAFDVWGDVRRLFSGCGSTGKRCVKCTLVEQLRPVVDNLGHNEVMESVIVRNSAIMSGAPTFRGTRVLVRTLFEYLEAGHSLERFLDGFPTVTREQALQALEEARESLLASH